MINFCTLFNSNYLTRGIALYKSLQATANDFHLYVLAFDDACYEYLVNAGLPKLTPISLKDFEDEELLRIKPTRSAGEYCWTCTPSVILYCINTYHLPSCTYLDADMIFYHDPAILLDELEDKTVMITGHRYSKQYDQGKENGIYCVQFMYFENKPNALHVLQWWRARCIEWCYARLEDGKFGDQKYLDDWTDRFDCVHVLRHPGGGVAPWNLQQYQFKREKDTIYLTTENDPKSYPVVFFHFHGLKFYTNKVSCTGTLYEIDHEVKQLFFLPYISDLCAIDKVIKSEKKILNGNGAAGIAPSTAKVFIQFLIEKLALMKKGKFSGFNFSKHYHFYNLTRFQ